MLLSLALTSFLTGVTEPIEFTFMFLAPVLYAVHAVLTGLVDGADGRCSACGSASASRPGLFDYVLNFGSSTRPLLLLPVGALYFADLLFRLPLLHRPLRPQDAGPRAEAARPGRRRSPARRRAAPAR